MAVVRPVADDPLVEIRVDGNMFMSRHDLGLRFVFCDPRSVGVKNGYLLFKKKKNSVIPFTKKFTLFLFFLKTDASEV